MIWTVKLSSKSEKCYLKLPKKMRERVREELISLENLAHPLLHKDVQPLLGKLEGFFRLRIGFYGVIFSIPEEEKIIAVVNIHPRGDVYKK